MKTTALTWLATIACSMLSFPAAADVISISNTLLPFVGEPESPFFAVDRHAFFVTTDNDILSVGDVRITNVHGNPLTSLHQDPLGHPANAEPPQPPLVAVFPFLSADSWITTPGETIRLGADMPGDGITTFGDLSNDGAQTDFMFAQLTVPRHTRFFFEGTISIVSSEGSPYTFPFLFAAIPEPSTPVMAAVGMLALRRLRKGRS